MNEQGSQLASSTSPPSADFRNTFHLSLSLFVLVRPPPPRCCRRPPPHRLFPKSKTHIHTLDWCAFALDGVKNVTNR